MAAGKLSSRRRLMPIRPKRSSWPARAGHVEIVRVVDENATNLEQFGLANPSVIVEYKAAAALEVEAG